MGTGVGAFEGWEVGAAEGWGVGMALGWSDGKCVGTGVGDAVGPAREFKHFVRRLVPRFCTCKRFAEVVSFFSRVFAYGLKT